MKTFAIAFSLVALGFAAGNSVQAQQQPLPMTPMPLRGNVNVDVDSAPMRISRTRPPLTSEVAQPAPRTDAALSGNASSLFDANAFTTAPRQTPSLQAQQPVSSFALNAAENLARALTARMNQPSAPAAPNGAPFIWYQNGGGGYYDGSGTTKDIVRADRLYLYGGKFADGTIVPKEPITSFNAMGHAYKQNKLNTQSFWTANGR